MSYCVTPNCYQPQNENDLKFCQRCGSSLLLKARYRALKPIGQGGFGRTFLAIDEDIPSKPSCVIKQLYVQSQDAFVLKKAVDLFHQEAERLERLGVHPQIPNLLAHFEQEKQLYLVQDFIAGKTLEQEVSQQGVFHEAQILALLRDLLPVLKFVHDRHVIHRDIKPANIIRHNPNKSAANTKHNSAGKLVLIDFGVAKVFTDTGIFETGTTVGSAGFMAPEQSRGKALPASDLYSLGVTCIHLLTGKRPFDLFDIHNDNWVWRDYLPRGVKVSDRVGSILDKLLKDAIKERYQSADEVLEDLKTKKVTVITPPQPAPAKIPNFFTNLLRPYLAKPERDFLVSAVGVDYTELQHLLAAGRWQQADEETGILICQVAGRSSTSYLQNQDIARFPCEDLKTIDQLWVKYSNRRFGFSIQNQIYADVEREYPIFCDRVGWPVHNSYIPDLVLNFSQQAPVGHLPSRRWLGGYEAWRHAEHLATRLKQCSIA